MTQIAPSVGIDCGKTFLDAAVFAGRDRLRVENTPAGHAALVNWVQERGACRVGLEASGGYERAVRHALCAAPLAVHIFEPARVRHFAKAKGRRAKTDRIDAALIAEFTATLTETSPVTVDLGREEVAGLIRLRWKLVDTHATLNKAVQAGPAAGQALMTPVLDQIKQSLKEIEAAIDQHIARSQDLSARVARLQSAPGIGAVTAVVLAVLLPELGQTSGGRIAALLGVAPYAQDSGTRTGERHIAGGRADVRHALYMAVLSSATRGSGVLATFYTSLVKRGKPPKVALTACMRKLIVRLNAMLAHNKDWSDQPA